MRVECLLARRLRVAKPPPSLPSAETEPFACVAVIDISGYTQLTDRLAALGGIDRIKDVLNPPFELIISTVHKYLGSVIKLAGDSAIVVWTIPPNLRNHLRKQHDRSEEEIERSGKEHVCSLAMICCMELLERFEDFQIKVNVGTGSTVKGHYRSDKQFDAHGRRESVDRFERKQSNASSIQDYQSRSSFRRFSTDQDASQQHQPSEVGRRSSEAGKHVQKLRLHIGLG
ncbi:Adenylate cyclase type 10, partial [Phlyctochytrium planicorne]